VSAPPRLTVCEDCWSGSARADQKWLFARLRVAAESVGATVRSGDCLDACDYPGTVVVQRRGSKPVWLSFLLTDASVDDLEGWLVAGGPGVAPLPAALDPHRVSAPGLRKAQ
jgi:predicted metal-binding protein